MHIEFKYIYHIYPKCKPQLAIDALQLFKWLQLGSCLWHVASYKLGTLSNNLPTIYLSTYVHICVSLSTFVSACTSVKLAC